MSDSFDCEHKSDVVVVSFSETIVLEIVATIKEHWNFNRYHNYDTGGP